ncbi:unnamed protein product [Pylaiella littoralis]
MFGDFDDREGFNGACPSDPYLRDVWHTWFYRTPVIQMCRLRQADGIRMTRQDYLQRVGQLVDGMVLAGDASFKYAKVIRLTSAGNSKINKPIQGVFTILNECEQASYAAVFQKAMKTASLHGLKSDLKNLFINRYLGHGFKLPVLLLSDYCCEDRAMFVAMFREIEQATGVCLYDATASEAAAGGAPLEAFAFPEDKKGHVVWDDKAIDLAVAALVESCKTQGDVLGMDCEWEPPFDGSSESAVCTLQLALPDGTAYLFHFQRGARRTTSSTSNRNLKRLLNDPSITKVGVAVRGDGTRLQRDYDVETRGMVDLRSYARACWVDLSCRSLAGMTATALRKSLLKDPARVCCRHGHFPFFSWQVRLYTNNHASCVALGTVQTKQVARSLLEKWGTDLTLVGRAGTRSGGFKRVVVKVVDVLKPVSFVPHKGAPPPAADEQPREGVKRVSVKDMHSEEGFVLWDVVHVRLAPAHRSFRGTPVPAGGSDPDAYQDDFFDAPKLHRRVLGDEDDESSDDDTPDESGAGVHASSVGGADASGASADNSPQERNRGMFSVRLDLFHALNRISRTVKKGHGAFKPFMARLRDACFLVNRDDIQQVEMVLEARGMTPEHVQQVKERNWALFLRSCRRLVPPPDELCERFDRVIEEFGGCVDNDSREVILRPKAMKAVRLLRKHIVSGCLSDPNGMAMSYAIGKNKGGLTKYRCVRGTNDVEGYHRYLRTLLAS